MEGGEEFTKGTLPKMLKYKSVKPKGLPTRQRRIEVNQLNNQNSFSFNDIIRFQFQTESFIDPYESYIEIQVEVPQDAAENMPKLTTRKIKTNVSGTAAQLNANTPQQTHADITYPDFSNVPLYLLDGPATSLISEMVLYSNGKEIERIQEYDQLGMLMADIGINIQQRAKSGYYGLASSFGKSDYSYLQQQMNNRPFQGDASQSMQYSGATSASAFPIPNNVNKELISYLQQNNYGFINTTTYPQNAYNFSQVADVNANSTGTFSLLAASIPEKIVSPLSDYLDIGITQNVSSSVYSYQSCPGIGFSVQAYSLGGLDQLRYNKHPGIFETSLSTQYSDILNGKIQYTSGSLLQADNTSCYPNQYINYAREFALQDGQYGIEAYDTVSIPPFVTNITKVLPTLTSSSTTVQVFNNNSTPLEKIQTKQISGSEYFLTATDNSTNELPFTDGKYKRRKKILYNAASNQNNFTYFAPGIMQTRWVDGKPMTQYNVGGHSCEPNGLHTKKENELAMTKKTFYIPILSAVMGHLIPQDQWKLIPGAGCGMINFEFRLNRYAFFMSGHKSNDGNNPVDPTASLQFHGGKQGWKVKKFSLHFTIWDFPQSVTDLVMEQLSQGIIMNTQAFVNGPIYQVANTSQLKGNWQINTSVQSMKRLYFWFLLDDYQKYNFCRKNFRISHNMKSIQLKLGQEFIPEQPITGHAGQLFELNNQTTKDYQPFYMELLRSHGEMFCHEGKIQILPQNFIVNERAFDPSDPTESMFQTAFLHETRLVGKSLYTVDLEADPFDNDTLSGKNVSQIRPFEIILDTHAAGQQTRASTMYTLIHCDMLVQFSKDGIQTVY